MGQSVLASPKRHPFWLGLLRFLVERYDRRCYAPSNTGPDAVTEYFNERICPSGGADRAMAVNVSIEDGLVRGPIAKHWGTGSWRKRGITSGQAVLGNEFGRCPRTRTGRRFAALDLRCDGLRRRSFV